jgi:hypothetical protein
MELEEKIKLIRALRDISLDAALKYKTYDPKDPAYQNCLERASAASALTIAIDIITNDGYAEEVIKGFTKEARSKFNV